jgi:hypothetical protein
MEPRSKSPAGILGIIGGALLVIGSILPWAKVSLDLDEFASVLGVDPSTLAGSGAATSQSVGGLDADGTLTLLAGIVVLICAGLFLAKRANTALGALIALGGLAGAGIAIYDIVSKDRQLDEALAEAGPQLEAIGLNADTFKQVFTVSFSIGIYACLAGGIVALIAGAMALMAKSEPIVGTASDPSKGAGGFGETAGGFGTTADAPTPIETPPPSSMPPVPPEDPPGSTP